MKAPKSLGNKVLSQTSQHSFSLPTKPFHTYHRAGSASQTYYGQTHQQKTSTSSFSTTESSRPILPGRRSTGQTHYMRMLLALDDIPRLHNIMASFFTWILLAGFVIFPGTFTNLQSSKTLDSAPISHTILHTIKNVPLLVIATISTSIGALGMLLLSLRHASNYVWLINKIFLPGTLHSLAGLISTLVNVYTSQHGDWSITAKVTTGVTGSGVLVCGMGFAVYNFWMLGGVKRTHEREMEGEKSGFV
ncbi:hypothetical protein B0J14DRAFT_480571 [Halenospora varia]|nr:hypothetical protein B0J14DRAFT_480571 [Halenospora varia]